MKIVIMLKHNCSVISMRFKGVKTMHMLRNTLYRMSQNNEAREDNSYQNSQIQLNVHSVSWVRDVPDLFVGDYHARFKDLYLTPR